MQLNLTKNLIKILSLSALLFVISYFCPQENDQSVVNLTANIIESETELTDKEPLILEAKTACVFDVAKEKYLLEYNSSQQRPLASLTKIITALVAAEQMPETALVEISEAAILNNGDSGFKIGEKWQLKNLINVMLLSSSNDAAFAIASSLRLNIGPDDSEFIKLMNKKAAELNLFKTHFLNATGLDLSETVAGSRGSCKDITNLMAHILKYRPELMEVTTQKSLDVNGLHFENTNKILDKLPLLLAGKTGFDDLAGGNLTIAVDKSMNHPIIITVLGSSYEGRFADVEKLYNHFVK